MIAIYSFGKTELRVSPKLFEEQKKIMLRGIYISSPSFCDYKVRSTEQSRAPAEAKHTFSSFSKYVLSVCTRCCSVILLTPWTIAHQAPLSMEFLRQEYWSGLPFPPPGIFPTQESNPHLLHHKGFFTTEPPGKPTQNAGRIKLGSTKRQRLHPFFWEWKRPVQTKQQQFSQQRGEQTQVSGHLIYYLNQDIY